LKFHLVKGLHVHVSSCAPLGSGDVSQSGSGKVQAGFAVRKRADDLCTPTDFLHQALQRIVGSQLDPLAIVDPLSLKGTSRRIICAKDPVRYLLVFEPGPDAGLRKP
jgi:hypothetical protein